jgi:hypothetical protein
MGVQISHVIEFAQQERSGAGRWHIAQFMGEFPSIEDNEALIVILPWCGYRPNNKFQLRA